MGKETNTLIGILAGTAIGATLGILFAPDKGIHTRQRIADEAQLQKERLANSAIDLKDRVAAGATDLKERVATTVVSKKHTLDNQLESIVTDASYKADDVISTLEKKLADLKVKNKKLQKTS
jgi:gas vesicle protein